MHSNVYTKNQEVKNIEISDPVILINTLNNNIYSESNILKSMFKYFPIKKNDNFEVSGKFLNLNEDNKIDFLLMIKKFDNYNNKIFKINIFLSAFICFKNKYIFKDSISSYGFDKPISFNPYIQTLPLISNKKNTIILKYDQKWPKGSSRHYQIYDFINNKFKIVHSESYSQHNQYDKYHKYKNENEKGSYFENETYNFNIYNSSFEVLIKRTSLIYENKKLNKYVDYYKYLYYFDKKENIFKIKK